ncbi:MAG TPA: PD-(D/E)XK nuclease family protein [Terracidiphilus sp.]|nr:PD-(D/E)XK nuclease family protein [Terracidiphilus sp.]
MGKMVAAGLDAWLREGGLVVTASERAARALLAAYHRARCSEGLTAWPAPAIQPWSEFVRDAWQQRLSDDRVILNSAQEESLWAGIIGAHAPGANLLEGPRHRTARLAMEAHGLLCAYAPEFLQLRMRAGWQQDAEAFSSWLAAFDEACGNANVISPSRLALELIPQLESAQSESGHASRPPLLLVGFDRIQPTQRRVFETWGEWREATPTDLVGAPGPASGTRDGAPPRTAFYAAADAQSELAACAIWCSRHLAANSHARILVVSHDAASRRGEMERAFLRHLGADSLFEFTLGVPIDQVPLAHSAHLLLRWLTGPLAEHEVDGLFASGYAANPQESSALQCAMRTLRRRNREQPDWPLESFIAQSQSVKFDSASLAAPWFVRITKAQQRVRDFSRQPHSPLECAEFAAQLLESIGWPAARMLSSGEFQAARRFQQALETAGSLGFDGRRISWQDFLSSLARLLDEILFAPQSHDAPIQIVGPAESAGLSADAIWFLGVDENAWPATASTHSLLPLQIQRQHAMPHATPQLDWDLARVITTRLLASAPEVRFSFARHLEDAESRPSRLIPGPPQPLPADLTPAQAPDPVTVDFDDASQIPFPPGKVEGGAAVLTFQSQCPFKAFAAVRLGAQAWEPAQPSLTPAQRGKLLHAVMHAIWAGPPDGLRNLHDLENLSDRRTFIAGHVRRAFQREFRTHLRARMSPAYIDLEEQRLVRLIGDWLDYESTRAAFEVLKTEDQRAVHLAGLTFDLRLDRIDRLNDDTLLVIDYKTGDVKPNSWDLPRPDDVQLPLYAGFALDRETEPLGGLTFAKLRPGKICFAGRIGKAQATLLPALTTQSTLVRDPFQAEMLISWRNLIAKLARDFLGGRAEVDPRDYPKTCERCGLQNLCRIHENPPELELGENGMDSELAEAADE